MNDEFYEDDEPSGVLGWIRAHLAAILCEMAMCLEWVAFRFAGVAAWLVGIDADEEEPSDEAETDTDGDSLDE